MQEDLVVRRETEKAFQVILDDGTLHWFPRSQTRDGDSVQAGDRTFAMHVTRWIMEQKELL